MILLSIRATIYDGWVEHPKEVGDRTTLAIMLALHESGYQVSTPFGENTRYDLVLDDGARLLRLQCKTGRMRLKTGRMRLWSRRVRHRELLRTPPERKADTT